MAIFKYYRFISGQAATEGNLPAAGSSSWIDLPDPSKFTFNLADIDADTAGRMTDGTMERTVLATKRSLNFEWPALTNSEISTIYAAIATTPGTENSYFFGLSYPDAATGQIERKVFYCGDRSTPSYTFNQTIANHGDGTTQNPVYRYWTGLTVNFVEK